MSTPLSISSRFHPRRPFDGAEAGDTVACVGTGRAASQLRIVDVSSPSESLPGLRELLCLLDDCLIGPGRDSGVLLTLPIDPPVRILSFVAIGADAMSVEALTATVLRRVVTS
ncbi:MAG: hypothetical protein KDK91_05815 [Gammaproteobacteria bacterium]|nr:hypothetical protein [Gammaproteobacteria bacterium]